MQLKHLEVLHFVLTTGSFTAAARQMGLQQPAVSKAVQRCETDLGVRLFERSRGGRVLPTKAARQLALPVAQANQDLLSVQRLAQALVRPLGKS